MEPKIQHYLSIQPVERQGILSDIHAVILEADKTVTPVIEPMMGKEMILYKAKNVMKYGLSSVKNYMSLHVLPMYGSKPLYSKYQALLPKAKFQKGCINFDSAEQIPLEILRQLIVDSAPFDLQKMREQYQAEKKAKEKAKNPK